MVIDRTKPDASAPDKSAPGPVHNVSSLMSISTPSIVNVSPSKLNEGIQVATSSSGPSKHAASAVVPHTGLGNMDTATSGAKSNEDQEVPSSESLKDALRLLSLLSLIIDANTGESMSDLLATFLSGVFFLWI